MILAEQALQKGYVSFDQIAAIKIAQACINYEKGKGIKANDAANQNVNKFGELKGLSNKTKASKKRST